MSRTVEFLDADDAMAAAAVLKRFGLDVDGPHGREISMGDEAPVMAWTVTASMRQEAPYPEPHEDDFISSDFDRQLEEWEYRRSRHPARFEDRD